MKKYFVVFLFIICLSGVKVNAETNLVIDCEPKEGKRVNEENVWQNANSKFFVLGDKIVSVDSYVKPEGKYYISSDVYNNLVTFGEDNKAEVVLKNFGQDFIFEDGYLYVYSGIDTFKLKKIDSSYKSVAEYEFADIAYNEYSNSFLSMYNNELYIYLEKNGGAAQEIYKLNLENETVTAVEYTEDNYKKYFEEYFRKSNLVDNGDVLSQEDVYYM